MLHAKKTLDRLILRFLNKTANKQEHLYLWRWLWQLDIRRSDTTATGEELGERLWQAIARETVLEVPPVRRVWWPYPAAAVTIGGLLVAGWLWLKPQQAPVVQYVIRCDSGQLESVTLPDSTIVILNHSSSLSYSSDYNQTERRVTLQGEGYFTVYTDPQHPFILTAGGLETEVLGTSFNVEAAAGAPQVRVSLTAGKVAIRAVQDPQTVQLLEPGQMVRYETATGALSKSAFSNEVAAWTTGGLSFNGIPLAEALGKLAAHYHIKLQYNERQLAGKTVTASMGRIPWQDALSGILFPHSLTYKEKKGIVIIQ